MADKAVEYSISDGTVPPPINTINFEEEEEEEEEEEMCWSQYNSWSHHEIVEEEEDDDDDDDGGGGYRGRRLMPAIMEECSEGGNASDLFSIGTDRNSNDVVHVVTWRGSEELLSASIDALVWAISNGVRGSGIVYLVHVFPELRFIPTPLGRLPISQANPQQKESYVSDERSKRVEYLQKFLSLCSSAKIQVETVLIESDMEAKAILDLIPILNIRKLVMGATKSNLRKLKSSSKKGGGGTLDQILHNAPQFCEVKVICEGKEVLLHDQLTNEPPVSPYSTASSPRATTLKPMQDQTNGFVRCSCFKL